MPKSVLAMLGVVALLGIFALNVEAIARAIGFDDPPRLLIFAALIATMALVLIAPLYQRECRPKEPRYEGELEDWDEADRILGIPPRDRED